MLKTALILVIFLYLALPCFAQYIELTTEDDDLCSLIKRRKIRIGKDGKPALRVTQRRLSDHSLQWEKNFLCKFNLHSAGNREGMFAVIQLLNFRKNDTTDDCIDYVQLSKRDGSTSPKFCGRYNAAIRMDQHFIDAPLVGPVTPNAFIAEKGELDVEIFVSREPLKVFEASDIDIVFTTFKRCGHVLEKNENYRSCGSSKIERDYCISSSLFNDGVTNCPFTDCVDEGSCIKLVVDERPSLGNKVLIGSISSLFIMFAVFIICIWICRNYRIFCWSDTFAHTPSSPSPSHLDTSNRRDGLVILEIPNLLQSESSSSVPPIDEAKDLPPSYDSLFPSS